MKDIQVNRISQKAQMIYDGNCGFCCFFSKKWSFKSISFVDFIPLQETSIEGLPHKKLKEAVHFIDINGDSFRGAEAIFRFFAAIGNKKWIFFYNTIPGFKFISEFFYKLITKHRGFLYRCMKFFRIV